MMRFFKKILNNQEGLSEEVDELLSKNAQELTSPKLVRNYLRDLTLKKLEIKSSNFFDEKLQWMLLYKIQDKFDEVNLLCDEENLTWSHR